MIWIYLFRKRQRCCCWSLECISDFASQFTRHVITYSCWYISQSMLTKWAPGHFTGAKKLLWPCNISIFHRLERTWTVVNKVTSGWYCWYGYLNDKECIYIYIYIKYIYIYVIVTINFSTDVDYFQDDPSYIRHYWVLLLYYTDMQSAHGFDVLYYGVINVRHYHKFRQRMKPGIWSGYIMVQIPQSDSNDL